MNKENIISKFDAWLEDGSDAAALVMRQWMESVEGKDAVIFPPTYAKPQDMREEWPGYNIDGEGGSSVCQIDSVGSQANRMEPIFKCKEYKNLVPQVVVKAGSQEVNLLDAGHRAADAIVRFSDLDEKLKKAFIDLRDSNNAEPLAKIAPTSIVFGAWDSRDTHAKLPRIVRSVIRAYDVQKLHRSATYMPPIDYVKAGAMAEKDSNTKMSEQGFLHAPATWTHGGILVKREIRREATLNLAAIRALGRAESEDPMPLRRYILALSLVAFTAPQDTFLREGCQLVPDAQKPAEWRLVRHDGSRKDHIITHDEALQYATEAANTFGVGENISAAFDCKKTDEKPKEADKRKKAATTAPGKRP